MPRRGRLRAATDCPRADKLGCRRMLLIGMLLARDVCGVDLPASIERSLGAPEAMNGHCRDIQLRLFDGSEPPVNLARTLTFLRSRERLCDRMLIALRFVWPELKPNERDRALIRLPHCMRALYIPIRLVRLILFCWRRAGIPLLRGTFDKGLVSSDPRSRQLFARQTRTVPSYGSRSNR